MPIYYTETIPHGIREKLTYLYPIDGTRDGLKLHLWQAFSGQVVDTYERNGHDDSDFYAVCWDSERMLEIRILTGTTRFPSWGCWAEVDISEAGRAEYRAFKEEQKRTSEALERSICVADIVARSGVAVELAERFVDRIKKGAAAYDAALTLLSTRKFRSTFRKSLRDQLEAWLLDSDPKFASPFSPRQIDALNARR